MGKKKNSNKKSPNKKSLKHKVIKKDAVENGFVSFLPIIAVILITFLIFLPTRNYEFTNWDDQSYVTENPYIMSMDGNHIKTLFLSGVHPDYPDGIAYNYHPLTMLSLAANYKMTGLNPSSYHWTNLLFHLMNVFLVFHFLKILLGKKESYLAAFGALLFAIHPLHVESVAWISERKDVLFCFFYLLGLISYMGVLKKKTSWIPVYLFFICSLLSKPSAVTFPIALIVLDYAFTKNWDWKSLLNKIPLIALSFIFGLITISIQGDVAVGDFEKYTILQRLGFASFGVVHYVAHFLFPVHPTTFYPYPSTSAGTPLMVKLAPIAVLLLSGLLYVARKHKLILFGAAFFLLNIALTLQFVQVGSSLVSDRYTYISYLGLIVILMYAIQRWFLKKNAAFEKFKMPLFVILALWSALLMYKSFHQVKTWENSETLWSNVIEKFPRASIAYNNLGNYQASKNDLQNAIITLDKAVQYNGASYDSRISRSNVLRKLDRHDEALADLSKAISLKPNQYKAFNNRGNIYFSTNQYELAMADYQKAISLAPNQADSYGNVGSVHFKNKNYEEALKFYDQALSLNSAYYDGYINKGVVFLNQGKTSEAITEFTKFINLKGSTAVAHYYRSVAYKNSNQLNEALADIEKALSMDNNQQYGAHKIAVQNAMRGN